MDTNTEKTGEGQGSAPVPSAPEAAVKPAFKEIELSCGLARIMRFKGKHIRQATRDAEGDSGKMMFALIAATTTINDKSIIPEDLDEMDGEDVLKLQGAFM